MRRRQQPLQKRRPLSLKLPRRLPLRTPHLQKLPLDPKPKIQPDIALLSQRRPHAQHAETIMPRRHLPTTVDVTQRHIIRHHLLAKAHEVALPVFLPDGAAPEARHRQAVYHVPAARGVDDNRRVAEVRGVFIRFVVDVGAAVNFVQSGEADDEAVEAVVVVPGA